MVLKRKAVASAAAAARRPLRGPKGKAGKASKADEAEWDEEAMEEEQPEEQPEEGEGEAEQEEEEEGESPEDAQARQEQETVAARKKELKGLYSNDLKELVASKGLEASNKAAMIEAVVAHEAAERAAAREHAAKMRAAVTGKKQELESMPLPQLRALCQEKELTGVMTKQARVEQLLKLWQEDDGVPKALAKMACDAREAELSAMDKLTLRSLCDQASVNPFVKEIMVDRIVKCEAASGRFKRPQPQQDENSKDAESTDIVEALLSGEATRKKEKEQKKQREAAAATKRKELRAMSNEQLKKLLSSKGLDAGAKKDEMVEVLYTTYLKDEEAAARKAALKALPLDELKKLALSRGLAKSSKKEELVDGLLAHEERLREEAQAYEAALEEVLRKHREELEAKTHAELKELCTQKELKLGVGKEEKIERLLEHARGSGEMEEVIVEKKCNARKEELLVMEVSDLEKLAHDEGADTLVKEVMVERLMSHEASSAAGGQAAAAAATEPAVKKPRRK